VGSITLELCDLAHHGDAVGFHEGKAVFVPLAIPGEVVRPSSERVSPTCPHFGSCGGCQWQHISYQRQLEAKRKIILTELERIGKQIRPIVHPMIGMKRPWAYRNHLQLSVDSQGQMGFQSLGSHNVVPVSRCYIAHPTLNELWTALDLHPKAIRRVVLRTGIATGERMLILEGDEGALPEIEVDLPVSCLYRHANGETIVLTGDSHFHERLGDRIFRISGGSFFQVNTLQAERVVDIVRGYLALRSNETLLDAYCGVGTLGLSLAPLARCMVGIEESPWAIQDAIANSTNQDHARFIQGKVEEILPDLDASFDAIVLDPPRAGCERTALRALAACDATRIVYVSCDAATLARDVAYLGSQGYTLAEVQPVDMFPQTYHVEAVALLYREA